MCLPGVVDIPLDDRRVLIGVDDVADLVDGAGKSRGRSRADRLHGPLAVRCRSRASRAGKSSSGQLAMTSSRLTSAI